jgi:predicted dehydrogenase
MIRLALVGGAAIYHARAFSGLINGLAPEQTLPQGWPNFPQCVDGAKISVVWDEDRNAAEELARVFGIDHVASTFEEVLLYCDGVIIADDVTLNHCRHAPFFLERGIPTFIDKPLAPNAQTAAELIALATKHNAPLMSGSALRYAAETRELRDDPNILGKVELATAIGPNELFFYGIHPLELAHSIMGSGVTSVQNIGTEDQDIVKVQYQDGRVLMLLVSRVIGGGFEATFYGKNGRRHIEVKDSTTYYANQLRLIIKMTQDKKAPVPIENALEVIRILEAGKKSFAEGGAVITLQIKKD